MGMKNKKIVAIGILITDESIYLAQLVHSKDEFIIEKLKSIPITPHSFLNGKVKDADALSNQILREIDSNNYNTSQIIVGFSDSTFLKHIEKLPMLSDNELKSIIEEKLITNYSFLNEDMTFGFQKLPQEINKNFTENIEVLVAFLAKSKVMAIKDLFDSIALNIFTIDLEPLSIIRTISCNNFLANSDVMSIYIASDYIDINVLLNGEIIYTYTIKKNMQKLFANSGGIEEIMNKIKNFVLSYENRYPQKPFNKFIVISSVSFLNNFLTKLNEFFPNYEVTLYSLEANFSNIINILKKESILPNAANEFIPAIGFALKYFEEYNKTISLIKPKKQIAAIINVFEIALSLITLFSLALVFLIISFYLNARLNSIENKISQTKDEIRIYSTGEYIQRQQHLQELQGQIFYYDKFRIENSRINMLHDIVKDLPDDIYFENFQLDETNTITISGVALLMNSIYQYYKYLSSIYVNVEIVRLNNIFLEKDVPKINFQIKFIPLEIKPATQNVTATPNLKEQA